MAADARGGTGCGWRRGERLSLVRKEMALVVGMMVLSWVLRLMLLLRQYVVVSHRERHVGRCTRRR